MPATTNPASVAELAARVEALLAPTVGKSVPEYRLDEADPLSRIALAKSNTALAEAFGNLAAAIREQTAA